MLQESLDRLREAGSISIEKLNAGLEWGRTILEQIGIALPPELARPMDRAGWTEPHVQGLMTVITFILAFLIVLLVLRRIVGARRPPERAEPLSMMVRRPKFMGLAASVVLVLFFGSWSVLAPLSSAAIAPGVVSPEGDRKTVAHLEGGIVRSIHVREGDVVAAGDPLVTLEDVQARARYEELHKRLLHLTAMEARLLAQRSDKEAIPFPENLVNDASDEAKLAMEAQQDLLASQRATQAGREKILHQRILQLEEQNAGLEDVTVAQERQIELVLEEIRSVQTLYDKGLAEASRLLALKRAHADLEADKALNRAHIAENAQRIGETEIQLLTMREAVVEQANDGLAEIQRLLGEIRSQIPSREDVLARTVVRASMPGTVMNIHATTEAGVLRPGETILEIVPSEARLIIDARVKPNDIDRVLPGMTARVVLTAYKQRNLPMIHGVLRSVSADRLVEDRTGEPYFLAKVEVNSEDLAGLSSVRLIPGMPTEVMILNEEKTVLEYLFEPILKSANRSLRES
ncbi:HlyD family type I secretion periplasmic adaptor subunit [Tropicimonas sp. IMCC6043]|uniref:HlyD family type I secretion periplasmic adaptor subunit n=1 Tax=Tropicimonas sp. IMCC6043 TaxID=2510645 RepID=UPI00101CF696|nr:HlyD family type I secretion periplasmic adaptor subunit [Tropicimonas sp. IMCC6043]RYH11405.1 HlyD family type I secretion periplasmic adaptor subunit [Tropicimonas sp. IMCC6043]